MYVSKSEREWLRFRWEFLRRDPKYREAWEQRIVDYPACLVPPPTDFLKCPTFDGSSLSWFNEGTRSAISRLIIETTERGLIEDQEAIDLAPLLRFQDFGLSYWLDPDLDFENIVKDSELLSCLMSVKTRSVLVDPPTLDDDIFGFTLRLSIDLSRVNSKQALKDFIIELVDEQFESEELKLKRPLRMSDYDKFLKAGLMKESGKKHKEIAEYFFPSDFDIDNEYANPESAEAKAKQYVRRYRELVNGGHINMTFP